VIQINEAALGGDTTADICRRLNNDQFFDFEWYVRIATGVALPEHGQPDVRGAVEEARRTLKNLHQIVEVLNGWPELTAWVTGDALPSAWLWGSEEVSAYLSAELVAGVPAGLIKHVAEMVMIWASGLADDPALDYVISVTRPRPPRQFSRWQE
jgi:hypothetical protein